MEIARCQKLESSRVSTRHLYGNFKNGLPFPRLPARLPAGSVPPRCSICRGPFPAGGPIQRWISLGIATDALPLLVHACSDRCIRALPRPPDTRPNVYVDHPHEGGRDLEQPPTCDDWIIESLEATNDRTPGERPGVRLLELRSAQPAGGMWWLPLNRSLGS